MARTERGFCPVTYSLKRCFCTALLYRLTPAWSQRSTAVIGHKVSHQLEDHHARLVDIGLRSRWWRSGQDPLERGGMELYHVARARVQETDLVRQSAQRVRNPMVDL